MVESDHMTKEFSTHLVGWKTTGVSLIFAKMIMNALRPFRVFASRVLMKQ